MNKKELIDAVAERAEVSKNTTASIVNAMIDVITFALEDGDPVQLVGFGTFNVRDRAARTGRNPATGESVEIAATTVPFFHPGKTLKDAVA